jgi:hypothetical protein
MIRSPIDIRDMVISHEEFEFRSMKVESDTLVRCSLDNCRITLEEPCWADFHGCAFHYCTILTKKKCGQPWYDCRWIECNFVGEFALGLGSRTEDCPLASGPMVIGCDFTQTSLEGVLFGADLPSIRFPHWPNVTILEPYVHQSELRALKLSPALEIWWFGECNNAHASYSSKTFNWDEVVKRKKSSKFAPVDLEPYTNEIRSVLGQLPYVIM